jgi:hypothetical protein
VILLRKPIAVQLGTAQIIWRVDINEQRRTGLSKLLYESQCIKRRHQYLIRVNADAFYLSYQIGLVESAVKGIRPGLVKAADDAAIYYSRPVSPVKKKSRKPAIETASFAANVYRTLAAPLLYRYRRTLDLLYERISVINNRRPERIYRWVEVVDVNLGNVPAKQERARDTRAPGKRFGIFAVEKVVRT